MAHFSFVFFWILLPFLGTTLGSSAVFFLKKKRDPILEKVFFGFAAGVMIASLVWSLLLPALEEGSIFSVSSGLALGMGLFLLGDFILSFLPGKKEASSLLSLSVTLHNIPEGMAVGVAFGAAKIMGGDWETGAVLALGIALQNVPEGAVISLPLRALGARRWAAFRSGALSGIVEPIFALGAFFLTGFFQSILSFVLAFAAGAMLYVTVSELIPSLHGGKGEKRGVAAFLLGFEIMMILDVLLGG